MAVLILNESQLLSLINEERIYQTLSESYIRGGIKEKIKNALIAGVAITTLISAINRMNITDSQKQELISIVETEQVKQEPEQEEWKLISDDTIATIYNAEPRQCNKDVGHTASMFRLNLSDVLSHRIIAMERTMMQEFGLHYGDVVKIEGTGKWDGEWRIEDTMNKKFAGQHKIDILLPKSEGLGKWNNVKIYALTNPEDNIKYKENMAPQLSQTDFLKQQQLIKNGQYEAI